MNYAIYDTATGRIAQVNTTPNPQELMTILQSGQSYVQVPPGVDNSKMYISGGEVTDRPQMPADLNGLTLTDVPVPCIVHINHQSYETDESTVELEFDQPGTYNIRLECWPYLDKEFTVEA